MRELYGILLSDEQYDYVAPLTPTIEDVVTYQETSEFSRMVLRVCYLAGFLKFRNQMRTYPSEVDWLVAIQKYIQQEFKHVMLLVDSVSVDELIDAQVHIGELDLTFRSTA